MLENSNPSNESPASTHYASPTTTCVDNNVSFTTQLLNEFNARQEHHISILSTSLVQYVPSFSTPSMQEVASPPPLHICINPDPNTLHPPMSPGVTAVFITLIPILAVASTVTPNPFIINPMVVVQRKPPHSLGAVLNRLGQGDATEVYRGRPSETNPGIP